MFLSSDCCLAAFPNINDDGARLLAYSNLKRDSLQK